MDERPGPGLFDNAEAAAEVAAAVRQVCEALAGCVRVCKEITMVYQHDLKREVARHYGLRWSEVNLPYPRWIELRARYLRDMEGEGVGGG